MGNRKLHYVKYLTVLTLLLCPAFGQAQEKKAMNYVIISEKNAKPPKPSEMLQSLSTKKPEPVQNAVQSEQSANQAWDTYKALATGQAPTPPTAPTKPSIQKPAPIKTGRQTDPPPPASATGIAGLLQQYQKTKATRSQMNTLVVNPRSGE